MMIVVVFSAGVFPVTTATAAVATSARGFPPLEAAGATVHGRSQTDETSSVVSSSGIVCSCVFVPLQ